MSLRDDQVLILSAVRTPIAKFNGQLSTIPAPELGSIVLKECLSRSKILCDQLSEIILGQLLTAGQGLNPARQAALLSNFPPSIPAVTVNMACASGLKSILLGFQSLRIGDGTFVLAGGQENMSLSPHSILIRKSIKFGNINLVDTMLNDSLIDPILHEPMGFTAERVAKVYGISRQDQDEFSFLSHFRANQAIAGNTFESETVSLSLKSPVNSIPTLFSLDEGPRTNVCLHNLSQLKPYWLTDGSGTVTPGNASTINDGAACILLSNWKSLLRSNDFDVEYIESNRPPMAKIISISQSGCQPSIMGIAPVSAIKKALTKANWVINDVDIWEINEAFAATTLACLSQLHIDISKVNITGGAIALGHPVGASGCRILVSLLHRLLQNKNDLKGVAAICAGGGLSVAICVEKFVV